MLEIPGIEGVTFSGGEPFAQAEALAELGRNLQANGLNVVTFSGFSYPYQWKKNRKSWRSLLHVTDLLIAGPYTDGKDPAHPLLASPNQSMVFLSDRLRGRIAPEQSYREIELGFDLKGDVTITGFPDQDLCIALGGKDLTNGDIHVALQQGQNQN
jgi:anaerobic ribonucleoside-triphosphate reductase activating protein